MNYTLITARVNIILANFHEQNLTNKIQDKLLLIKNLKLLMAYRGFHVTNSMYKTNLDLTDVLKC